MHNEIALSQVATIIMGQSPSGDTYNSDGVGKPLLNGPTEFGEIYPEVTLFTTSSTRECLAGDLIFCVRGSTTGRMNWADQSYSLGRGVCAIRGETMQDTRYIRYCIELKLDHLLVLAGGGTFPNLTKNDIHSFKIPYPSTRRKITAVLSAYDDLIENNLRRIKLLEQAARDLYQEWFVHFRFPGHEHIEIAVDGVPVGWTRSTLGAAAYQKRDSVQPKEIDPDTPYVGLEHIPRRSIALYEWGKASDVVSTKLTFQEDDILFGKIRPYFHKVVIAPVAGVTSSDTIVIAPREKRLLPLILMCVSSDDFVAHATQTSQGTKMPRADWNILTEYPVLIPDDEVLEKFGATVSNITCLIRNLVFRNAILRQQRDFLLPRLISGELDVSNLNIPVSEELAVAEDGV